MHLVCTLLTEMRRKHPVTKFLLIGCCQRTTARKTPAISTLQCSCQNWQPMSNSWSTSSQPDFARALGRRRTSGNRPSKILYTELLKSWQTLGQLLANSRPMGSCRGLPCCNAVVLWQHPTKTIRCGSKTKSTKNPLCQEPTATLRNFRSFVMPCTFCWPTTAVTL